MRADIVEEEEARRGDMDKKKLTREQGRCGKRNEPDPVSSEGDSVSTDDVFFFFFFCFFWYLEDQNVFEMRTLN